MGMSGGGGTKSTSTSSSISGSAQSWAKPFATNAAKAVQGNYDANQPGLMQMSNTVRGDLFPALVDKFKTGIPVAQQAQDYYSKVLQGGYSNPELNNIISMNARDMGDAVASQMSLAGRYGSDVHQGTLERSIGDMASQLRYGDYSAERDRMAQAAQGAQAGNLADVAQALAGAQTGAELPYTGSNDLANALGALFNGGTSTSTSTQKQSGGGLLGGIGSIMSGIGAMGSGGIFCDARLKENVSLNRIADDGLAFYDFDYKKGVGLPEGRHVGLPMAQDVAKLRPWAMGPTVGGYLTIRPNAL